MYDLVFMLFLILESNHDLVTISRYIEVLKNCAFKTKKKATFGSPFNKIAEKVPD